MFLPSPGLGLGLGFGGCFYFCFGLRLGAGSLFFLGSPGRVTLEDEAAAELEEDFLALLGGGFEDSAGLGRSSGSYVSSPLESCFLLEAARLRTDLPILP